jgi:hypothetical protein
VQDPFPSLLFSSYAKISILLQVFLSLMQGTSSQCTRSGMGYIYIYILYVYEMFLMSKVQKFDNILLIGTYYIDNFFLFSLYLNACNIFTNDNTP